MLLSIVLQMEAGLLANCRGHPAAPLATPQEMHANPSRSSSALSLVYPCRFCSSIPVPSLHLVNSPAGRHAKLVLRSLACQGFSSNSSNRNFEEDIWQRVQLLERVLEVAIMEENYSEAKRIRDQLIEVKAQLSEAEQLLLEKVTLLTKGSINEKIGVITVLGNSGDNRVLPALVDGLRDSDPLIVSETERAMWKIFMRSGRDAVDRRLQEGVTLMLSKNFSSAKDVFTEVIKMAPLFAEGWNKRATINYLLQDYKASIQDCKQALELNPYHFGALSGMGLCYVAVKDFESALLWFEKANAMHPSLGQINKYIEVLKQKLAQPRKEAENKNKEDSL